MISPMNTMQRDEAKIRQQVRSDLQSIFRAELSVLEPLAKLMSAEQEALKSQDLPRIIELSESKEQLLGTLQAATAERLQTMQILGYSPTAEGLDELLAWSHADKPLLAYSRQVYDLTKFCHDLNVENGMQINKNQEFVIKSLNILLGLGQDKFTGYDASGSRRDDGEYRNITTI